MKYVKHPNKCDVSSWKECDSKLYKFFNARYQTKLTKSVENKTREKQIVSRSSVTIILLTVVMVSEPILGTLEQGADPEWDIIQLQDNMHTHILTHMFTPIQIFHIQSYVNFCKERGNQKDHREKMQNSIHIVTWATGAVRQKHYLLDHSFC